MDQRKQDDDGDQDEEPVEIAEDLEATEGESADVAGGFRPWPKKFE